MSKLISLKATIEKCVNQDSLAYIAGIKHLFPFAARHEIIRKGLTDRNLARISLDVIK